MHSFKIIVLLVLTTAFVACTNLRVIEDWPQTIPPQGHFLSIYESDTENQGYQSDIEYLTWVVRFYQGWELMPIGWNDIVDSMMLDLDERQSERMHEKLQTLGVLISAEWAKDNQVRAMDSAMLSLWGSVMQADFSPQSRFTAVEFITADVSGLLSGELRAEQVNDQRYVDALGISLDF